MGRVSLVASLFSILWLLFKDSILFTFKLFIKSYFSIINFTFSFKFLSFSNSFYNYYYKSTSSITFYILFLDDKLFFLFSESFIVPVFIFLTTSWDGFFVLIKFDSNIIMFYELFLLLLIWVFSYSIFYFDNDIWLFWLLLS